MMSPLLLGLSRILNLARRPRPRQGSREPDVPFQPSPKRVVEQMLVLAGVHQADVVYDLGCGDGRILIAASRRYGARGVGIDINPRRIEESLRNAREEGVRDHVTFRKEDLFGADISEATVVVLFLWPEVTRRLHSKLRRDLRPGTRVVSYYWEIGNWLPDKEIAVDGRPVYLWTVPAKPPRVRDGRGRRRRPTWRARD